MKLDGTYTFGGPQNVVWTLLQDPAVLAQSLPGVEQLETVGPDQYRGVMKVSVGPVTAARFNVLVTLTDKTEPQHFVMQIDAKGAVGHTRGTATIDLAPADDGTMMHYTSNVQVGGTIAAVGQRMLESVGRAMMKQALESLDRELKARLAADRGEG
jgi:carbon monoxide dehydrogenase subunit G